MAKKPASTKAHAAGGNDLDALLNSGGGTATATADAAGQAAPAGQQWKWAEGFEVVEIDLSDVKPNKVREPTEEAVAEMVKSIRANGLKFPILLAEDNTVVDGMTRYRAYEKMNRKQIPARFDYDATGSAVKSNTAAAFMGSLVTNFNRRQFTPLQLGELLHESLKKGYASDAAALAKQLGTSATVVNKALSLVERGTKELKEAAGEDKITGEAAAALIAAAGDDKEQRELLETLLAASAGKRIKRSDVVAATQGKSGAKRGRKAGRKASRRPLSAQSLNAEETGMTGLVRKNPAGGYSLSLQIDCDLPNPLARFDLVAKVQALAAKLDAKTVRNELDVAMKALGA